MSVPQEDHTVIDGGMFTSHGNTLAIQGGTFFTGGNIHGGSFNVLNGNNNRAVYTQDENRVVKVTVRRLYPQLEDLLHNRHRISEGLFEAQQSSTSLVKDLHSAVYAHVSNRMPIRLLQVPDMKLLERNAVAQHIIRTMSSYINENLLKKMLRIVEELGSENTGTRAYRVEMLMGDEEKQEEDARENPWGAICRFLFSKFACYTILSHTWLQGEDREIIYNDTLKEDWWTVAPSGEGFDKLAGFANVAHECGGTLVWIDTLCINKDSSAELDESIRSMYRWYHDASLCIVHLRDTLTIAGMTGDTWFRRGWTLQELLAPVKIKFYNREWEPIVTDSENDKLDWEIQTIIEKTTTIDPTELVHFHPVSGSSVATRMAWAANRVTSRGEDRAYSLMGIFGVNFPISYGEGAARAFFRLVESIITTRSMSHIIQTLSWAGVATPETVHTSRLIPSAPECYIKENARFAARDNAMIKKMFAAAAPEPISLTHLGLRVRFLILSTISSSLVDYPSQQFGPFYAQLELIPSARSHFEKVVVLLEKRFLRRPKNISAIYDSSSGSDSGVHSLYFGIYTFQEDERTGTIEIPCCAQAFILAVTNENAPDSNSIHDVHPRHFKPTSKIGTREIVRLHHVNSHRNSSGGNSDSDDAERDILSDDAPSVPAWTVLKSRLHASDMKLLHLYL